MFKTLAVVATLTALAGPAGAVAIVAVPGTSNLWLAGMPNGTDTGLGDSAPGQSPVAVPGLTLVAGQSLRFTAIGSTDHCDAGACGLAGAEGDAGEAATGHSAGAQFGISNLFSPIDALIGVFLDASQPDGSAAPIALAFISAAGRDFASLSPELKQAFFIGDGRRNDGTTLQDFVVPAGATRLFLGTMDGFGWFNNVGSLRVTVDDGSPVPEPSTVVLLAIGAASLLRRRARRVS